MFHVSRKDSMDLTETLPVGNYVVCLDSMNGIFYLEKVEDFSPMGKIYGDVNTRADRILSTFNSRSKSTGVLLVGKKGSGKTLLARQISLDAAEKQQIPTLIINTQFVGDKFNSFIQSIEQPCIIFFDEFEKIYDRDHQEVLLTLFDGTFPSKKLFLLTSNNMYAVDANMRNRPGRIFYMIEYGNISIEFIEEYCNDNLKNKHYTAQICQLSVMFEFNFDMLKSLVEEMNRYNESPTDSLKLLNIKEDKDNSREYELVLEKDGVVIKHTYPHTCTLNPLIRNVSAYITQEQANNEGKSKLVLKKLDDDEDDDDDDDFELTFNPSELIALDSKTQTYSYRKIHQGSVYILNLVPKPKPEFAYSNFDSAYGIYK